jgi:hypothetical protein
VGFPTQFCKEPLDQLEFHQYPTHETNNHSYPESHKTIRLEQTSSNVLHPGREYDLPAIMRDMMFSQQ